MPEQDRPNTCKSCRAPTDGASRCDDCRAERRRVEAAQRAEKRKGGRCLVLSCRRKAKAEHRYCATHLEYFAERQRAGG